MAPGQLVSSSSSRSWSWMRPDRPLVVSRGQPAGGTMSQDAFRKGIAGIKFNRSVIKSREREIQLFMVLISLSFIHCTCQRQETEASHPKQMLEPKVLHLEKHNPTGKNTQYYYYLNNRVSLYLCFWSIWRICAVLQAPEAQRLGFFNKLQRERPPRQPGAGVMHWCMN